MERHQLVVGRKLEQSLTDFEEMLLTHIANLLTQASIYEAEVEIMSNAVRLVREHKDMMQYVGHKVDCSAVPAVRDCNGGIVHNETPCDCGFDKLCQ